MSRRYELAILVSLCAALFASCLLIYTQNNAFPYYNHHDEENKVEQLLDRDFNFNHPHLLLLSTDIVRRARGQTGGYQDITLTGRWVSATFAAASVVLLTLVGWKAMGLLGAWCVGLFVAVCPIVGLTSHFMKEDTALLLGFSASVLALLFWVEKPSKKRLIWLGVACGLAASAKYVGGLFLVASALLVLAPAYRSQGKSRFRQLAPLLGPAALVFVVINWPMFLQLDSFIRGLSKGVEEMLGISAFLLALLIWLEKPNDKRLIWLGVACGLAASVKYIGVLLLIAAALLVLAPAYRTQGMSRLRQLAPLLGPATLVFVVINWPEYIQFESFVSVDSFVEGLRKGANEAMQSGKSRELLSFIAIPRLMTLSWPVLIMASIGALCLITAFRRSSLAGWVFFSTFLLSTGLILVSAVPVPSRYLLLPAVSLHALAGLAIAMLAQLASTQRGIKIQSLLDWKWIYPVAGIAAVVLTATAIPVFQAKAITAFEDADPRAELIAWANSSLNDGTKLAAHSDIRLPGIHGREPADPAIRFKQEPLTIRGKLNINPDTVQEMRSNGITHLVLREWQWSNYLAIHGPTLVKPVIVWRTPARFKTKNRWMRANLVVVQL